MPFHADPIRLSREERQELEGMTRSRALPDGDVTRARMILMLAEGHAYRTIQERLGTTAPTIARWKERFLERRLEGLSEERHARPGLPVRTPRLEKRVLAMMESETKIWSRRSLAQRLKVSKDTVQRIVAGARPGPLEPFLARFDPDFRRFGVIGLYSDRSQHAAVFSFYGKWMTLLDGFPGLKFLRQGTVLLNAALAKGAARDGGDLVEFLEKAVKGRRPLVEIRVILDRQPRRKAEAVAEFLKEHKYTQVHVAEDYQGWLDRVESWVGRLERDRIGHEDAVDLTHWIMVCVRGDGRAGKAFGWVRGG